MLGVSLWQIPNAFNCLGLFNKMPANGNRKKICTGMNGDPWRRGFQESVWCSFLLSINNFRYVSKSRLLHFPQSMNPALGGVKPGYETKVLLCWTCFIVYCFAIAFWNYFSPAALFQISLHVTFDSRDVCASFERIDQTLFIINIVVLETADILIKH